MAREYARPQRVADFLKRELAQLIQQEIRDPRIGMVNVNAVDVSRDLAHAKVFVTFLGQESEAEASQQLEILNKASGFLRSRVAAGSDMRSTPKLRFYFDSSISRGRHLSTLIEDALAADDKFHKNDDPAEE